MAVEAGIGTTKGLTISGRIGIIILEETRIRIGEITQVVAKTSGEMHLIREVTKETGGRITIRDKIGVSNLIKGINGISLRISQQGTGTIIMIIGEIRITDHL